jgi:hypothetical protein
MIFLGVLLVVVGVLAVAAAVITGDTTILLSWHQYHARTTLTGVFLAGAAALLVVELGVLLARGGSTRRVSRWQELRRLRRLERTQSVAEDGQPVTH